ncbi:MAG: type IV pilus assembly protein PilM [Armatimonadetes bacterium]|nr:type IV pilus assembly protein PilM [Armatimonadota bacterium]MDE2206463.1 type IV pilus assembly protein PilM [Armatimonadota bacterium]
MAGGSYVGLDIGTSLMKVTECRRGSGGSIEVTAIGYAPTPTDAYENSIIVDAAALGKAVKDLMKQAGVSSKAVVSSVAGQSAVVVRVIEVPQMSDNELAEAMKWEVERHVPFAVSEVVMDFKPIDRGMATSDGQQMEVLMAVAQQELIDRHVEVLFAAGCKPVAIDVEPLAVGRSLLDLGITSTTPGYAVAVINIGASNTDISIYRDKLLAFPRSLPLAGNQLTQAIASAMGLSFEDAERQKCDVGEVILDQLSPGGWQPPATSPTGGGFVDFSIPASPGASEPAAAPAPSSSPSGRMPFDFSSPGEAAPPAQADLTGGLPGAAALPEPTGSEVSAPVSGSDTAEPDATPEAPLPAALTHAEGNAIRIQVFNAMAPVLTEMAQEIRRSLDYYRGKSSDARVDEILITGGGSQLKNLAPFLEQELGVPAKVANPLAGVTVTAKNYSPDHMARMAQIFPVSVGLGVVELVAPAKAATRPKKPPKAPKVKAGQAEA